LPDRAEEARDDGDEMTANPNRRLWRDLKLLRIAGALPVAAIPLAIALMVTAIVLFDGPTRSETSFADLPLIYALAFIPAIISGAIHLGVARIRGFATRRQCLLWGVSTSFLLEAGFFAIILGPSPAFWVPALQPAVVLGALIFFPAGLASGWVYWCLGIRPGPRPDMSAESPASASSPFDRVESWERVFAGITVAAALTGVPMAASVLQFGAADLFRRLAIICLGAIGIWLIGGTAYVWLRKGNLRLPECLALGSLLGFLVPVAAIAMSVLINRAMSADAMSIAATFQGLGFASFAETARKELPLGLLGGWLFWRIAGLPTTSDMSQADPRLEGRWRDLRKGRVTAALVLAPGISFSLLAAMSTLAFGLPSEPSLNIAGVGPAVLIFELWCLAIGFLYLFVICRRRGYVRRRDCLFLGMLGFCLFPQLEVIFRGSLAGSLIDPQAGIGGILSAVVGAALDFLPFGLLSGWLFWRFGVRPTKPQELGMASVFD
jgi:hypothetical protein